MLFRVDWLRREGSLIICYLLLKKIDQTRFFLYSVVKIPLMKYITTCFCLLLILNACNQMKDLSTIEADIQSVDGDPMNVQLYTLDNGMRLYMCVMDDEPRIQTFIATRAGSKNDPSDATGLAHYLEHMLFKGSSKIAALDWKNEKKILDKIAALYEKHRTADAADRPSIYKEIDSLSFIAAKLVAANEYDKMISSLAKGTNALHP